MEPQPHERTELPATARGRLKLTNWVIGTVPDIEAAQQCTKDFMSAGFAEDDVLVESAATALRQLQADEDNIRDGGSLARLFTAFEESLVGIGPVRDRYIAEARAGRAFVGARDAQGNQVDLVRGVLLAHGAATIHLFELGEVRYLG